MREEEKGYPGGAAGARSPAGAGGAGGVGAGRPGVGTGTGARPTPGTGTGASTVPKIRFKGTDEERKAYYEIIDNCPDVKSKSNFKLSFNAFKIKDL